MASEEDNRLATELSLLEAMYPDQVTWERRARDLTYVSEDRSFQLRLSDRYPDDALPQVLSATLYKTDVREDLKRFVQSCATGEEILDSVISALNDIPATAAGVETSNHTTQSGPARDRTQELSKATVIVWLHHLLNTNKRKQALSPVSPRVCGVTKPGYPGVLIYSGTHEAVHDHVNDLKQLNWQAFQIRLESDEEWHFTHGNGVKEVETMKDVVAEVGADKKQLFMEAVMRMK